MTRQIAALPFTLTPQAGLEFFLVTSRGSGRWIIPKGNPIAGMAPQEVAACEASEEAGLIGQAEANSIGSFRFSRRRNGNRTSCSVDVYPMRVQGRLPLWDEMGERQVRRCTVREAVSLVTSRSLASILLSFAYAQGMGHPQRGS